MKELEVKSMLEDNRIPEQYKLGGRLSSEFLDGVDYAEQRIMEKGVEVWVARDGYRTLMVFGTKPHLDNIRYRPLLPQWVAGCDPHDGAYIAANNFPEVTFENSPVKARIILED